MMDERMMIACVSLEYYTKEDEALFVSFWTDRSSAREFRMTSEDSRIWHCQIKIRIEEAKAFRLRFSVKQQGRVVCEEVRGYAHSFPVTAEGNVHIICAWNPSDENEYLYRSAYSDCIFSHPGGDASLQTKQQKRTVVFAVTRFLPLEGKRIIVCGNQSWLGHWNPIAGVALRQVSPYGWMANIDVDDTEGSVDYKYLIIDAQTGEVEWEEGDNRTFSLQSSYNSWVIETLSPRLSQRSGRVAGVVIPVFSLRSEHSWGVGDFGDLRRMVDWASSVGLHVLQVLPLNDTTRSGSWQDSYPYNGISAFALHPLYAALDDLGLLESTEEMKLFSRRRKQLNDLPLLDYEKAMALKVAYLQSYYASYGGTLDENPDYQTFCENNRAWLLPYAQFRFFQSLYHTSDFRCWPKSLQTYSSERVAAVVRKGKGEDTVRFHCFVQYILDRQLRTVHRYAQSKGVVLKGDIPIGVSRDSATAWLHPSYFHFDSQAGAPPDYFATEGQNWGFPTYHWENILEDGGRWWQKRLQKMSDYFDAYRIDHVLGFFRIWEIPVDSIYGTLGHFSPALPLSRQEIRGVGFESDPGLLSEVSFTQNDLEPCFGERLPEVKSRFLEDNHRGGWCFKVPFRSQRQIAAAVDASDEVLRQMLLDAQTQVLFLRDKDDSERFHPCIAGQKTLVYRHLSVEERAAYDRLYNDFFYVRHNDFWERESMKKLPLLIHASRMLPCAEDLGMIPACVRGVLQRLHILSLEVESMPKGWTGRFSRVGDNPLLSVDTLTTHDMAPLRLWWQENPADAAIYYHEVLHHEGEVPQSLSGNLCEEIIRLHLQSPSLLCVLSYQDWSGMDEALRSNRLAEEQINQPANPHHYWRYRMDRTIEQLQHSEGWNLQIRHMTANSGR